jgi:cyclase
LEIQLTQLKIFNEKEVDELIVLDIDATKEHSKPDFEMIKNLTNECKMPFCYGGYVASVEQAKKIIQLGAEKVALSSSAIINLTLIKNIGSAVGVQSVVIVIDVKKNGAFFASGYDIYIKNGKEKVKIKLKDFIVQLNEIGVGEIIINSIDNDGLMKGYDIALISMLRDWTDFPVTDLGGAGSLEDIKGLIKKFKIIGASAGSFFIFKGKNSAVLINYPNREEKLKLFN